MSQIDKLIINGTIVTAESTFDAAVGIDNGTIVGVSSEQALPSAERTVDADGNLIFPGVVDPHVHLAGYNSIDSYQTGTAAAAAGGVTSLITFAWQGWEDDDETWNDTETLSEAVERHQDWASPIVDYSLHAVITRERESVFEELPELAADGVSSFKMFTTDNIRLSYGFIDKVFDELSEIGAVGMVHTEDYSVCEHQTNAIASSPSGASASEYPSSRPDYSEAIAARTVARLAAESDAKYYGAHTTSEAAAEAIAAVQTDGSNIRAETCTHYTTLDADIYHQLGNIAIMAPPLRQSSDVDALFEYLHNGVLSVVSTDHVPLQRNQKEDGPWWESDFGINSLQTSLPVFHEEAVNKRDVSYPLLVRLLCYNPAQTFGLPQKGRIEPGADADLVVFDPDESYTISAGRNHSNADYSVYDGREVTGKVMKTFVRGKLVADAGDIVVDPGYGEFLERKIPSWGTYQ